MVAQKKQRGDPPAPTAEQKKAAASPG
jgi:hypothetical protein